ncbi:MAG TPA: T9SS type A sorting domain-containing protein, partial [Bacteroidia bacterium]|nr:T9SS type A sorting domain-containing protein [Bacteroidia bacterium]
PVFTSAVYRDSARKITLGIAQIDPTSSDVKVYPNPSNGIFTVQIANNYNNQTEVYNMLGEKVYSAKQTAKNTLIDLSGKSKGVYFYSVSTETGSLISQGKLLVQ